MPAEENLNWEHYLKAMKAKAADPSWFKQWPDPPKNLFKMEFMLEAADVRSVSTADIKRRSNAIDPFGSTSSAKISPLPPPNFQRRFLEQSFSLAKVVDLSGPRLRLRFVSTDDKNDVWLMVDSDSIRKYPSGHTLQPPFGFMRSHCVWTRMLDDLEKKDNIADAAWFLESPVGPLTNRFLIGSKLEAVDRSNPDLICPATVTNVSGDNILISFDGWKGNFDYWTRFDSRDIFPVDWSKKAGCVIQMPGPGVNYTPPVQDLSREIAIISSPSKKVTGRTSKRNRIKQSETTSESTVMKKKKMNSTNPVVKADSQSSNQKASPLPSDPDPDPPIDVKFSVVSQKSSETSSTAQQPITAPLDPIQVGISPELLSSAATEKDSAPQRNITPMSGSSAGMLNSPAVPESTTLKLYSTPSHSKFSEVLILEDVKPTCITKEARYWNCQDVSQFLAYNAIDHSVVKKFYEDEIDGQALLLMTMDSIRNLLGVKLGPALKIEYLIKKLKTNN